MIFITGGTGLVGAHLLLDYSLKGIKIKALKRINSELDVPKKIFKRHNRFDLFKNIEWVDGDVLEITSLLEGMSGCDEVIHAAAFVSFAPKEANKMVAINVQGTENVVNACLATNIRKLGYVSSVSTLNRESETELITEENYWKSNNKNTNYGISKYLAEQEVWRGIQEGLSAVIINPSVILGPGDWNKGSSQLFMKVWKGLKYYSNGGTAYVDVLDVSKSMVMLMDSPVENERFIISSENIKYRTLFDWIAEGLDKKKADVAVTPFLKELAWRLELVKSLISGKKPLLTRETANQAMKTTQYSNQKIKDFGMTFTPVRESVKTYSKWFIDEIKS
jgi:dihydroflavonol-4-reductase